MNDNENKVTWEDYKQVEKELDEMYIKYATATTASVRMLCACAIEEYHKVLSLMKTSLDRQIEGKNKSIFGKFFY
jgi:hypothetical protein